MFMHEFVKNKLVSLSDSKYQIFSAKLIPNINNVLGVRIPLLRKFAKELYKSKDFDLDGFLLITDNQYMEFVMLQGVLIGLKKAELNVLFADITQFVPKIDNWAVCDIFCASLKQVNTYKKEFFDFLQDYLKSEKEYELRFGVVMLLTYYVNNEYVDRTLEILTKLEHEGYYAQMAIAWALSICYVKFFAKTHDVVLKSNLSEEILKRTVRKVIESLRATKEEKDLLREFLKNKLAYSGMRVE